MHGCMDAWMHGCMDACTPLHGDMRILVRPTHNFLRSWRKEHAQRASGGVACAPLDLPRQPPWVLTRVEPVRLVRGVVVQHLAQGYGVAVVQWYGGAAVRRSAEFAGRRGLGKVQDSWVPGCRAMQRCRNTEAQRCTGAGVQGAGVRGAGVQGRRAPGALAYC